VNDQHNSLDALAPDGGTPTQDPRRQAAPGRETLGQGTPNGGPASISRRRLLAQAGAAGGLLWVAPAIDSSFSAASAQGSLPDPDPVVTTTVWKWNATPPSEATICSGANAGNANFGSAVFTRIRSTGTIQVVITITNGPSISTRQVLILQSDSNGNCLAQTASTPATFGAANNTPATFTAPITPGATHFALALLRSGGGGVDTYTTVRINLPA